MKNITKILASLSVMSLIAGCSQKNELQLKNESLTIEYGKTIPTEAKDYLKNKDDILSKVKVETNSKNEDGKAYPSVGEYTVTLTYDNQKKDVKVIVKDTVAPAIKDIKDSYEVGYGEKFDVKLLQKNVTDLGAVTLTIDDSKVDYKKAGSYKAVLQAKDESNNEEKKEISITVKAEKNKGEKKTSSTTSGHSSSSTKPSRPSKYKINMNCIMQNPQLPSGCEITSLAMVLNYNNYTIDKLTLSDNYLPKGKVGKTDFNKAFVGNPRSKSSYGCYAPVIVNTANKYLKEKGSSKRAINLTGIKLTSLYSYLDKDIPVIIWATNHMKSPYISKTWYVDGKKLQWKSNEHCLVLTGYDKKKNVVYTCDPLRGKVSYDESLFEKRYIQMGSQSVIIKN